MKRQTHDLLAFGFWDHCRSSDHCDTDPVNVQTDQIFEQRKVVLMYLIECYSVELNVDKFIHMSEKEIMQLCKYEYGVEVTPEIFFATVSKHVRYILKNDIYKCYYFLKKVEDV